MLTAAAATAREEEALTAKALAEANAAAVVAAAAEASDSVAAAAEAAVATVKAAAAAADAQLKQKLTAIIGGQGNKAKVRLASRYPNCEVKKRCAFLCSLMQLKCSAVLKLLLLLKPSLPDYCVTWHCLTRLLQSRHCLIRLLQSVHVVALAVVTKKGSYCIGLSLLTGTTVEKYD